MLGQHQINEAIRVVKIISYPHAKWDKVSPFEKLLKR